MTRTQIADDSGVNMRQIWLGPANSWRWAVDWTYREWKLAGIAFVVSGTLMNLIVPTVVVVVAAVWALTAPTARLLAPERTRLVHRSLAGVLVALLAAAAPSWRFWVLPQTIWTSIPLAFVAGAWFVRRFGAWVDNNRPLPYWLSMPRRIASGPRPAAAEQIDPSALGLAVNMTDPDTLENRL